ncbi:MAG: hypothetical protein ACI81O_001858 [Cyclobacteriaceae bacterium]|jgi:hypothetical protein
MIDSKPTKRSVFESSVYELAVYKVKKFEMHQDHIEFVAKPGRVPYV